LSATVDGAVFALNPLSTGESYTIDPNGANQTVLAINPEPPPGWSRPNAILLIPRNTPLALAFSPGDAAAPTAILIYAHSVATNSTVEVQCLGAPGASTFTIPADTLANLPASYQLLDGSYAELIIGTLGFNHAVPFNNGLAANGLLLNSSWLSQTVVIQ